MSFNDNFAGASLLIVFDEETTTGMILRRKLEGKALSFKQTQIEGEKGMFLIDDETGSIWEELSGRAVRGPLKGKKLEPLPATPSFWFGWVDHYPDTELLALQR
jgi:hypothetical protein